MTAIQGAAAGTVDVTVCDRCQYSVEITIGRTRAATADAAEALRAQWAHQCRCGAVGCTACMEQCPECLGWVCRRHSTASECGLVDIDGAPICLLCASEHIRQLAEAAGWTLPVPMPPPAPKTRWQRLWGGVKLTFLGGAHD